MHDEKQFNTLLPFLEKELFNGRHNHINLMNPSQTVSATGQLKHRLTETIYEMLSIKQLMTSSLNDAGNEQRLQLHEHLDAAQQDGIKRDNGRHNAILKLTMHAAPINTDHFPSE